MIEKLKDDLRKTKDAALLFSGGMDSTLILAVMREEKIPHTLIQFREYMTKDQLKRSDALVIEWDLEVFSYPPQSSYLIGKDKEMSVIFEYALGRTVLPSIRDVIPGEICGADIADGRKLSSPPIKAKQYIIGTRKEDRHYSFPDQLAPASQWTQDGTQFLAPLYDWTREDVKQASLIYGLNAEEAKEFEDNSKIAMCDLCLNGNGKVFCPKEKREIPQVTWDREANLNSFQNKFIYK